MRLNPFSCHSTLIFAFCLAFCFAHCKHPKRCFRQIPAEFALAWTDYKVLEKDGFGLDDSCDRLTGGASSTEFSADGLVSPQLPKAHERSGKGFQLFSKSEGLGRKHPLA